MSVQLPLEGVRLGVGRRSSLEAMCNNRLKRLRLSFALIMASGLSCQVGPTGPRQSCTGSGDTSCPVSQTCLWLHATQGAGYFCGKLCTGGAACPSGQTCVTGAGSSCMTCQDVVDVCE